MPLVYIRPIGRDGLAVVVPVEGPTDPGFGGGRPGGVDPGYDLPAWLRPGHDLPGGGYPSHGLPGGGQIDNTLPGAPGHPDNRPPSQPPQVAPGSTLVLVRSQDGKWHYAAIEPGSPPPRPVPVPPEGSTKPTPPGTGSPGHPSGQPVPPTPTPTGR